MDYLIAIALSALGAGRLVSEPSRGVPRAWLRIAIALARIRFPAVHPVPTLGFPQEAATIFGHSQPRYPCATGECLPILRYRVSRESHRAYVRSRTSRIHSSVTTTVITASDAARDQVGLTTAYRLLWLAVIFDILAFAFGCEWDRRWHATHPFEDFLSPPHFCATLTLAYLAFTPQICAAGSATRSSCRPSRSRCPVRSRSRAAVSS